MIVARVADDHSVVIRGLLDRDELRACIGPVFAGANTTAGRLATSGVPPEAIRANVVKWSIGGESTTQSGLPRFMVTVYNPLFADDVYGLHSAFRRLIEARDTIAGRDVLTDEVLAPDRWNACRVQIYPAGGGFMGAHEDTRAVANLADAERYIQLVLLLTEKGTDYQVGGAFVSVDGEGVDQELGTRTGDLLVYDGSTRHGVADVDPFAVFNSDHLGGRAVMLATVYDAG